MPVPQNRTAWSRTLDWLIPLGVTPIVVEDLISQSSPHGPWWKAFEVVTLILCWYGAVNAFRSRRSQQAR